MQYHEVIIIGGGQAGLSMSYYLKQNGIDHVVLERNARIAEVWRKERWDSFCLVTPNWQCQLPGFHYHGDDPDGFMVKDEIIQYLEDYVAFFDPPLLLDTCVESVQHEHGLYSVSTSRGDFSAGQVVIACGSYHIPNIPAIADHFPAAVNQIHTAEYKNAAALPAGGVLVVGSGQSGCQIAEDLLLEGRKTYLAVGDAPRVSRRYRGKDVVNWLDEMGYYETTIDKHPDGENAPKNTNHYVTGRDGGRDLNLRILAQQGMQLLGMLKSVAGNSIGFADDLYMHLDAADAVAERINNDIETYIVNHGIEAPPDTNEKSDYVPPTRLELDLQQEGITNVIWATGFRMDFSWIHCPVFTDRGYPEHRRGVTSVAGLYFLGLNWQNTWGSGRFYHVGNDAAYLLEHILDRRDDMHNSKAGVK